MISFEFVFTSTTICRYVFMLFAFFFYKNNFENQNKCVLTCVSITWT